ncbi:FtsX-like permease family protein [Couchioplanes caeruleus]|nr:FtsX-like permease family protein [Couchioplanes caeruleus]
MLGVRLSIAAGRSGWLRLAMIATGVGLGVAMLLLVASVPTASGNREQRRSDRGLTHTTDKGGLLVRTIESRFRDQPVRGRMVRADGPVAPVPPGLPRLPAPGEMFVSPALAELLDGPGGDVLGARWSARVAGTIAPPGLAGPREVYVYVGSGDLAGGENTVRVSSFGGRPAGTVRAEFLLLAVVGAVIMLVPVLIFLITAVRFGSSARERQLAAIRLVGADGRMTHRIAAGDSLVGAVLGLGLGALMFLAVRPLAGELLPADFAPFTSDMSPPTASAALIAGFVPAAAVAVTLAALRQVVIEPLGVVRQAGAKRRRLWWRLMPPAIGAALFVPLLGGNRAGASLGQVAIGVALLLIGVVVLLPWLVPAVVRRLRASGVAWQLAVRRLQLDSDTAVRAVSGIAVSVAGIIAFQGILNASVTANLAAQPPADRFAAVVFSDSGDTNGWAEALGGVEGVREVGRTAYGKLRIEGPEQPHAGVRVGDCDVLRQAAALPSCADGDIFAVRMPGSDGASLSPGTAVQLYDYAGDKALSRPTVPAKITTVTRYSNIKLGLWEYLATPKAVGIEPSLRGLNQDGLLVSLDAGDPDAIERVRNVTTRLAPAATVEVFGDRRVADQFAGAAQAAQAGAVLLLIFIGASLLVSSVEQLRERRRLLAMLTAFGTPRRVLSMSLLYQSAIPAVLGLALAVSVGSGLSAALLAATNGPIEFDEVAIAGLTATAIAVVLAVTAAGLPLLFRFTRVQELRTE